MNHKFNKDTWHVGQKVWDVVQGAGTVTAINDMDEDGDITYPVLVNFPDETHEYTCEGKYYSNHVYPTLYPYPVEVIKAEMEYLILYRITDSNNWKISDSYHTSAEEFNKSLFNVPWVAEAHLLEVTARPRGKK